MACASGRSLALSCVFAAVVCSAQTDPKPTRFEIRGVVSEAGVSHSVPDAEISLIRLASDGRPRVLSAVLPKNVVQTAKTDAAGKFSISVDEAGDYQIEVRKDGYQPAPGSTASAPVSLTKAQPRQQLSFLLVRPGELHGRVIDHETEKPVSGLRVFVWRRTFARGRAVAFPAGAATTDETGRFAVQNLQPGDYVVRPYSRLLDQYAYRVKDSTAKPGAELALTEFSDDDLKKPSWDYEQTWWPNRSDLRSAHPFSILSGSTLNVGDLSARKTAVYSVLVSFLGVNCDGKRMIQVNSRPLTESGVAGRQASVSCGKPLLMRGFPPGSYRLEAVVEGGSRDTRERGSVALDVVNENVKVAIPIARGADVAGRLVVPERVSKPDFKSLNLRLTPEGWMNFMDETSNAIDADGGFRIPNVPIRPQRLFLTGLKPPHYIKEMRYNGNRVLDGVLPLDGNASSHTLEIVVDDKPAAIWGSVTDGDRGVPKPHVVVVRWPADSTDPYTSIVATVAGDDNGKFQVSGLPPGEYRVFGVAPLAKAKLEEPDVLASLLSDAEKITLQEGALRNVSLRARAISH